MKIFDCFMYYNEDTVLDLRLNYLNNFVDHFIIIESTFDHRGKRKKLNFNIEKFTKFKNKISYFILDDQPRAIEYFFFSAEIFFNYSQDSCKSTSAKFLRLINGIIILDVFGLTLSRALDLAIG